MDVEKTIEFLLGNQAKHDERLIRLEIVVEKLADNVVRLDEVMVSLAESGVQTNRRIDQLGLRVDQLGLWVDQLVSAVGAMIQHQPQQPNAG